MNVTKYILSLLLFITLVATGVSTVITEFNPMVSPMGPVCALNLEVTGPGVYELTFLGEQARLDIPGGAAAEFFQKATVMASDISSRAVEMIEPLQLEEWISVDRKGSFK